MTGTRLRRRAVAATAALALLALHASPFARAQSSPEGATLTGATLTGATLTATAAASLAGVPAALERLRVAALERKLPFPLEAVTLEVEKKARRMTLLSRGVPLRSYRAAIGRAPTGHKQREGDGKTPEGVYYVSLRLPSSSYYKAFLLSYPDKADAVRGLQAGLISAAQKQAIDQAQDACGNPPQQTGLGGEIELHGKGGDSDWTLGCIAGDDSTIDEVWAKIDAKDTIVVYP